MKPTQISQENVNRHFEADWQNALSNLDTPINLKDTSDPFTRMLNPSQRQALSKADKNSDGNLTMREARDYLIQNSQVKKGGSFENFEDALNHLFTFNTGRKVDVTEANASVMYLQFNNNTTRGNYLYNGDRQAKESGALNKLVRADTDKPTFNNLDMTSAFNASEADAQSAFRSGMKTYLDDLIATGGSMTGLVVSGHSLGDGMYFEDAPHEYAYRLSLRDELTRFRNMEVPKDSGAYPYRALFNQTEKVGLLACFQGGNNHEWANIFPNATIAGTNGLSPDAGSSASPAIYDVAARTHEALHKGQSDSDARLSGLRAPNANRDGLQGQRSLTVHTPDPAVTRRLAEKAFAKASDTYAAAAVDINKVLSEGGSSFSSGRLRQLYRVARQYENTSRALASAGGHPINSNGAAVDVAQAKADADKLFEIRLPGSTVHR